MPEVNYLQEISHLFDSLCLEPKLNQIMVVYVLRGQLVRVEEGEGFLLAHFMGHW